MKAAVRLGTARGTRPLRARPATPGPAQGEGTAAPSVTAATHQQEEVGLAQQGEGRGQLPLRPPAVGGHGLVHMGFQV